MRLRVALLLLTGLAGQAREPRSRAWLVDYVRQPIPSAPHNPRYLALIDHSLNDQYLGLDQDSLERGGANVSRVQTNTIGRLAFCYRTPGLRYYRDRRLLEKLRQAYLAAAGHVGPDGFMQWPGDADYYWQAHEQSWRLEPLLIGYIWVGEEFPEGDRRVIEAALRRSAEWIIKHPLLQTNNRGMVWCAVATLAGLYFERPDYLAVVEQHAGRILNGVVWDDGEVGEHTAQYGGGGPDSNYSYTGWAYVYLYRLWSGNDELDPKLGAALRWFAAYNTLRGFPLVTGASVRTRQVNPASLQDLLPALERFSRQEPFYATLAAHLLDKKEKYSPQFGGHLISPLIWAMLERGAPPRPGPLPDWYTTHTAMYDRQEVQYALITRGYQTGVVSRGAHRANAEWPLRGMQTFAFGDEYPILLHTDTSQSSTRVDGVDTATTDADEAILIKGAKVGRSDLVVIAERRKTFWTLYAYTPVSAVVVYGGAREEISSQWVMNPSVVSRPTLDDRARSVSFEGRKARIHYLDGRARLSAGELHVAAPPPLSAFGFSDTSFRFAQYDAGRRQISFSDSSGRYRISVGEVLLPDGTLNRNSRALLIRTR